ncbi:MAG: Hpt domain-containing protein [Cytophagales bacterium]|nr:Hpt domain-containing protein [Cytophagales bacterium]MDW8383313.1 Hpt domain-containing protein [Flammeovirgaceae bacterium]
MQYWNHKTLSDLRELSASEEEFRKLLSEFFSDAFLLLQEIHKQHSANSIRIGLHTLKGLARTFGAIALFEKVAECEKELLANRSLGQKEFVELLQILKETQSNVQI